MYSARANQMCNCCPTVAQPPTVSRLPSVSPPFARPTPTRYRSRATRETKGEAFLFSGVVADLVVDFAAGEIGGLFSQADLDAFESLDTHDGHREARVEFLVVLHAGAEAGRDVEDARFDEAAERVAVHL